MKTLLIRPELNKEIITVRNYMFGEPLGLEALGTMLKRLNHSVELLDLILEKHSFDLTTKLTDVDVVCISSQCSDVIQVKKLAKIVKAYNPSIIVIVGGVQATCFPNSFFTNDIDLVFQYTTFENLKAIFEDLEATKLIDGVYAKNQGFKNNFKILTNEHVKPDRELTKNYRQHYQYIGFKPCAVLQTSYGCVNACDYCVRWRIEGKAIREVEIQEVISQLKELNEEYVMICDNDFLINPKRIDLFVEEVKNHSINKKYICYGSVNSVLKLSDTQLKDLSEIGLTGVIIGYESFEKVKLEKYSVKNSVEGNALATKKIKAFGIGCYATFMLDPDWSKSDFKQMTKYVNSLKPDLIAFSPLNPHPMTSLYEEYKDRLVYNIEEYDKWNFGYVTIYPSKMSLRQYYLQLIILGIRTSCTFTCTKYLFKTYKLKTVFKLMFSFNHTLKIYMKSVVKK